MKAPKLKPHLPPMNGSSLIFFPLGAPREKIISDMTASIGSKWGLKKTVKILTFFAFTFSSFLQADEPYPGSTSIFVNYSNAGSNSDLHDSPRIYISFDDKDDYHSFIMDTGSVGVVASKDIFKPAHDAKNLGKGKQYYSSSGIIEEGTWWTAKVKIRDADGTVLAITEVPVLQVTKIECGRNARHCTPNNDPKGISVMGIGFARESKTQPRGTPEYNAFLNLTHIKQGSELQPLPSDWCNGYVVTPLGVDLGLTSSNTLNAGWVKLAPWPKFSTPTLPEWMSAPMTIDINGVSGDGNILMDTGVGDGFLTPPSNANIGMLVTCPDSTLTECVPEGNVFGLYLPNEINPVAFYTFTIGEIGNLMQPNGVHVVSGKTFYNTSRHFLGGINLIYDNTNGYVGYIWNGLSSSDVGYVIPATAVSQTTLTTSSNPAAFGKKTIYTVKVVGADNTAIPTGTVTFHIDDEIKAFVPLDENGVAAYSTSTLPPLAHTVTAKYSGDVTYVRSSATLSQGIKPPTCF